MEYDGLTMLWEAIKALVGFILLVVFFVKLDTIARSSKKITKLLEEQNSHLPNRGKEEG